MPQFEKLSWSECLEDSVETLLRKVLQELREMREESQADKCEIETLKAQLAFADPCGVAKDVLECRALLNRLPFYKELEEAIGRLPPQRYNVPDMPCAVCGTRHPLILSCPALPSAR